MRLLRLLSGGLTPLILVAAFAAISAWWLRASVAKRADREAAAEELAIATVPARKGEFEVAVECLGELAAVKSKPAIAEVTGQIVYLAPSGVEVKKGDIIAELDVPRMARRVRDQEREYQAALDDLEAKKRDLAAEVERARIKLEQANSELELYRAQQTVELTNKRRQKDKDGADLVLSQQRFERQQRLSEEGLVPGADVELATTQLKAKQFGLERETKELDLAEAQQAAEELNKQAAVKEAEAELGRAQSKQEAETSNAAMQLEMRKTQLARVQDEFSKCIIRAPADGIVVLEQEWQGRGMQRRPVQPGDRVWEGRPVATIPDLAEMRADIELSQEQARLVKLKQRAVITVEAVPGIAFPGKVSEVSQTASESTLPGTGLPKGERTFQARVAITDLKKVRLRPGMTARARITVERIKRAVSVPLECVFEKEDRNLVYVRRGREFQSVEVHLGPKNDDAVVITKGLRGGEQIALRDVGQRAAQAVEPRQRRGSATTTSPGAGR